MFVSRTVSEIFSIK